MYEDMYKDYSDSTFTYSYPITFEKRNRAYMYLYDPIDISWYYGDTIQLIFNLIDEDTASNLLSEDESIPEYFEYRNIVIDFYNFRGEVILEEIIDNTQIQYDSEKDKYFVEYDIDRETSSKVFLRGIYNCGVKAVGIEDNHQIDTLLYYNDFSIRVM